MKAIHIHEHGGPDVLLYEEIAAPTPGLGQVLVRNHAIGVNFTDTYMRTGFIGAQSLPFVPGKEGAGEVLALGEGVSGFSVGDRVAYTETPGGYAEETVVEARLLVHLPEAVAFETAAAAMLKGLTAQYLLRRTFAVTAGQLILIHAAAGGVGLILSQWANHLGATVIGTVGSTAKAEIARRNGCHYVIDYSREDFVAAVKEITDGQGCHVVYDGVGKTVARGSLDCLRPFGVYVNYGWASGPVEPLDPLVLLTKGSLYATAPGLTQHLAKCEDVESMSRDLFDVIASGAVKIHVHDVLPLSEAREAHRRLEAREVSGGLVLRA